MLVHVKNNNIYITVYMHRYMCLHMCAYMYIYARTCTCTCMHAAFIYIHVQYTYTYIYMHTYIYIYAHVQYIHVCMYINCIIAGVHDGKTKREGVWNTHMLIRKLCCISMIIVAILYIDTTCNGNFINNFGCYYI